VNKPFVETFFPITDGGALLVANIFLNFWKNAKRKGKMIHEKKPMVKNLVEVSLYDFKSLAAFIFKRNYWWFPARQSKYGTVFLSRQTNPLNPFPLSRYRQGPGSPTIPAWKGGPVRSVVAVPARLLWKEDSYTVGFRPSREKCRWKILFCDLHPMLFVNLAVVSWGCT
jgi:hypothetical protein